MTRVAVCAPTFFDNPVLRAELLEAYPYTIINGAGRTFAGEELIAFLRGCEKAVTGQEIIDDALFAAVPELKVVSKLGVGLDTVDIAAMARHGARLGWTPGVNKRSVAELALSNTIAVLRQVPAANLRIRQGIWKRHTGGQLTGRTVGIIGCGNIGKEFVALLKPFQCRILVHDIRDYADFYQAHGIETRGLEDLLAESDVVSLHIPSDTSTRGMMSAERLNLMKPGAVLINTARGGIVDEAALKSNLQEGRLWAASSDVFAVEPPTDSDLLALPNFLASPHIGGSADEAMMAVGRAAIRGLADNFIPNPADFT
jgi:phosphoglycerate dehydrogenase-like enzyme